MVTNLSGKKVMKDNGWIFDVDISMDENWKEQCGSNTWYGYSQDHKVGSVSTVLRTTGNGILYFGNCYLNHAGLVKVYLNGNLISTAKNTESENTIKKKLTINFKRWDILNITEERGIIKLHSFEVRRQGKNYRFLKQKFALIQTRKKYILLNQK